MTADRKLTFGDYYKLAALVVSLFAIVAGCADAMPDGPMKHWLQALGTASATVHALLLDPRVVEILQGIAGVTAAPVLLAAALVAPSIGCATAGATVQQLQRANHDTIVLTEQLHAAGTLTDAQFRQANVILNRVAVSGRETTKLLRAGKATARDLDTFLAVVSQATADLSAAFPDGRIADVLARLTDLEQRANAIKGRLQ